MQPCSFNSCTRVFILGSMLCLSRKIQIHNYASTCISEYTGSHITALIASHAGITSRRGNIQKNTLETTSLADGAYLECLVSNNTTLEILVFNSVSSFSFFRADWFSQHFIPETIFMQNGLLDLNILPSAADKYNVILSLPHPSVINKAYISIECCSVILVMFCLV